MLPLGLFWLAVCCSLVNIGPTLAMKSSMTVAFAYFEAAADLGWTWRHNQGRIYMHTRLLEKYPTLSLESFYEENVPESPDCMSVFEAWAVRGVDLIVGTSYGHQFCMAALAPKYPNSIWFSISAVVHPNVSNWGAAYARLYQPIYLAGILAGHASRTGKVGCVLPVKIPETQCHLAAFALGVAHVNASYEVHVGWTNSWKSPRHEVLGTRALASLKADVVFYRADNLMGTEARRQHLFIIGFNTDYRMQIGESVLASPYFIWGVIFLQIAEMVLLGTFESSTPIHLFPGMREGTVALSDLSFLVKKDSAEDVGAAQQAILNGSDPFCGEIRTNEGTTVGAPGHCSSVAELTTMMWQPHNVIDHGVWLLPSQACAPGEYGTWNNTAWTWSCLPCPAGTYSRILDTDENETIICTPCAEGTVSSANSSSCDACSPGTAPSATNFSCEQCPADTYSATGAGCASCPGTLRSLQGASRCSEPASSTTSVVVVATAVGVSAAVSLLMVSWVLFHRRMETAKVMQNAPRGEVAIMFMDVQSSTTLWSTCPEAISWALDQHNRIVRCLFAEFDGYEVKTLGDASSMVVFQDAIQALQCAMRIQEDLVNQHWPLELQQEDVCSIQKDQLDRLIWNGPRVRTGIHIGTPELVMDREVGQVDYAGPDVNIAALVESKASGGQTLITKALHKQIPPDVLARYQVSSVGVHRFAASAGVLEVFSVLPESLSTRVFTELKENVCYRCECATVCPKCDVVVEQGLPSRRSNNRNRYLRRTPSSTSSTMPFFAGIQCRPTEEDSIV